MSPVLTAARALAAPRGPARLVPVRLRGALLRATVGVLLRRNRLDELLDRLASVRPGSAARPVRPEPEEASPELGQGRRPGLPSTGRPDAPRETVAALRRLPVTCLQRALAGYASLRAAGVDARFVIGVTRAGDEVLAHAWLEQRGAPLEEPTDPREKFAVVFTHPPATDTQQEEPPMHPPRPSPEILLTRLADGTGVLLHLGTKFYYTLNRTGVVAWEVISARKGVDRDAIVEALLARFGGVSRGEAESDVDALLRDLEAEDLLAREA